MVRSVIGVAGEQIGQGDLVVLDENGRLVKAHTGGVVSGDGGLMGEKPSERTRPDGAGQAPHLPSNWKHPTPYADAIEKVLVDLKDANHLTSAGGHFTISRREWWSLFDRTVAVIESLQKTRRDAEATILGLRARVVELDENLSIAKLTIQVRDDELAEHQTRIAKLEAALRREKWRRREAESELNGD